MRRTGHALDRDDIGEARIGIDMTAYHIEKIDLTAIAQQARDLQAIAGIQPTTQTLISGVADTNDELAAHPCANGAQHFHGEAQPILETAAVGALQGIGERRPELIHQVAVGLQLDTVEAGCLHALGGVGVVLDQPCDIPVLDPLGKGAVRRLTTMGRRDRRQPVGLVPTCAASQVSELDHHRGAVLMTGIRQLAEPRHHLIAIRQDVVEHRRAVLRHRGGARRHGQGDAGTRTLLVIGAITRLGHAIFRIGRLVGGHHQAILEGQMLERERREQRVLSHVAS